MKIILHRYKNSSQNCWTVINFTRLVEHLDERNSIVLL